VDEVSDRCALLAPQTRLHFIADREGTQACCSRRNLGAWHEFTIRAQRHTTAEGRKPTASAFDPGLASRPHVARMRLTLPASAAGREREALLLIRAARVPLQLRDRYVNETLRP